MALNLSPEEVAIGKANFERTVGVQGTTRRDFMKGLLAGAAAVPVSAAVYFGYEKLGGKPVKAGLIGAGDEGGVLIGEHNPEYLEFIAYSDIRPYNQKRIFTGEPTGLRKGFNYKYGKDATKKIKLYEDYHELLNNKEIEAIVIALPLHLHAPVAIDALTAGKHVLCEKLMAWNISQCKDMIKAAKANDRILSIGHQRHYSLLYAEAQEVLKSGILGDVKYIRALWHRNNARPKLDANGKPVLDPTTHAAAYIDSWRPDIKDEDRQALQNRIHQLGYKSMEELVRWRLYQRTGGGLMAELGSHQLDACSIFLGKAHPLAVSGVGGKFFYKDDREVDDCVFVTFEFPGKNYRTDKSDVVVVTYSSISTNSFEKYGEWVQGSTGTLFVEEEQNAMLWPLGGRSANMTVAAAGGGKPAVDTTASGAGTADAAAQAKGASSLAAPISRGYKEEMEHFAYCVRRWGQSTSGDRMLPRCHGEVAMADAIIALTSNQAMRKHQRIEFKPEWFDPTSSAVPDGDMKVERIA
jgi:predicted dehydrogenase